MHIISFKFSNYSILTQSCGEKVKIPSLGLRAFSVGTLTLPCSCIISVGSGSEVCTGNCTSVLPVEDSGGVKFDT